MVLEQLITSLADEETQRKLFTKPEVTLAEAEQLVIAEEIGKLSQADSKSVSQYKKSRKCVKCSGWGGVYALEIVKKADLSRFQSEVSQAGPSKSILIYDTKLFVDY